MNAPAPFREPGRDLAAEKQADDAAIANEWERMQARGRVRSRQRLVANLVLGGFIAAGIVLSVILACLMAPLPRRAGKVLALPVALCAAIGAGIRKRLLPTGQY